MLGIYVHWPYCLKKCPYCAFNSHITHNDIDTEAWYRAFAKSLKYMHGYTEYYRPSSIFFGGGTPSLMPPNLIERIIDIILKTWNCHSNIEVSLEANPLTCSQQLFKDIQYAGINRLSLGIQSFRNEDLTFLGRQHTRHMAIRSIKSALAIFNNVSCDLIYGLPNRTLRHWQNVLSDALFFPLHHISLYQLTIEENTPFHYAVQRGDWDLPSMDFQAKIMRMTWQILKEHGFNSYEISNFSKPRKASLHNRTYWEYGPYIGVGPGAHGRIHSHHHIYQTKCFRHPEKWLQEVYSPSYGFETFNTLTPNEAVYEYVLVALRAQTGINREKLEKIGMKPWSEILNIKKIQSLQEKQFLRSNANGIQLTEKGLVITDSISSEILH